MGELGTGTLIVRRMHAIPFKRCKPPRKHARCTAAATLATPAIYPPLTSLLMHLATNQHEHMHAVHCILRLGAGEFRTWRHQLFSSPPRQPPAQFTSVQHVSRTLHRALQFRCQVYTALTALLTCLISPTTRWREWYSSYSSRACIGVCHLTPHEVALFQWHPANGGLPVSSIIALLPQTVLALPMRRRAVACSAE